MKRWGKHLKAAVLLEVLSGRVSQQEIMDRHALSAAEVEEWLRDYRQHGVEGLSVIKNPKFTRRRRSVGRGRRAAKDAPAYPFNERAEAAD